FGRQLAVEIATRGIVDDAALRSRLETALEFVAVRQRLDIYLAIAWEGLKAGGADVVRWAADQAARLAQEGSVQHLRARLCGGAALIVTDQLEAGLSVLESIPADRLHSEEGALLAGAPRLAQPNRSE